MQPKMVDQMSNKPETSPTTILKVSLRPVTEQDLEVLYTHQCDPIANQLAQFSPRDREAFFAHWQHNILGQENVLAMAIVVDGKLVGYLGHWQSEGQSLVGYWIDREYWGKGVATQALGEFLPLVRLRPLFAHVASHNIASQRVLLHHGFRLTNAYIQESGDTQPLVEFVLD